MHLFWLNKNVKSILWLSILLPVIFVLQRNSKQYLFYIIINVDWNDSYTNLLNNKKKDPKEKWYATTTPRICTKPSQQQQQYNWYM